MRTIPSALQTHLNQSATTTCLLLKITLTNGDVFGVTTLDRDIEYDDGTDTNGAITYVAANGFNPSVFSDDIGYAVGNAEAQAFVAADVPGVTLEMAESGDVDDAQWVCYLVNFEDLTMGHCIIDAGDTGEVITRFGMVWIPELLSYITRLRQPIGSVWSRSCRAIFGTPAASQTGCGVDLAPLWTSGTISSVSAEPDREFTVSAMASGLSGSYPGRIQFLTGANAGKEFATEDVTGLVVQLAETTGYPVEVGDSYRIRRDCRKQYAADCIGIWANGENFKGEPLIPVGDAVAVSVPGGQLPGGGGYSGPTFAAAD